MIGQGACGPRFPMQGFCCPFWFCLLMTPFLLGASLDYLTVEPIPVPVNLLKGASLFNAIPWLRLTTFCTISNSLQV